MDKCAKNEGVDVATATKSYGGEDLKKLAERISGKVVTLTENKYPKGSMDYFEEIDNNFVIFPELFEEINCSQ